MIAVSRSLTSSDVSIVTVEAALSARNSGKIRQLPNWSPSFLPAANEAAAAQASRRQTG